MAQSILLVEDEDTLRETLAEQLEQDGYRVTTAADGAAALSAFRSTNPDLVLLDLMLPELAGMEVLRILRRESNVPVLLLTARASEIDKVVGLEVGADDYVTKPFSLRELQARVRALLRRRATTPPDASDVPQPLIGVGGAQVDLAGHRLLRGGEVQPIKPKAFDLLAFFLRHPGQVFTRDQLLAQVWGYEYAGETRTVDVHVHWLRSVIEEDPRQPRVLETVRGQGYVLRAQTDIA